MNKMSCFLLLAVLAAGCVSKDGKSVYCIPVFYRDDFGDQTYTFLMPPLAFWHSTSTNGLDFLSVLPLFAWQRQEGFYTFLFAWDERGTFWTLLGGRRVDEDGLVYDYYTPFFGNISGTRTGGWVFPFWSREKDLGFDEKLAILEKDHLPKDIRIRKKEGSLDADSFWKSDRKTYLRFMDFSEEVHSVLVCDHDGTNCRYRVTHEKKREFGPLDFNAKHQVEFDVNTRERITEEWK